MQTQKRFLSRAEVAREIGVGLFAIDQAIRRGELQAIKLGGRILVARASLERFLADAELRTHDQKSRLSI